MMPSNTATTPVPFFVGDHPAMDLLNTYAVPGGTPIEWLSDGRALAAWWAAAGRPVPGASERQWDEIAGRVRALREAFRRFVDRHAGRPLAPAAAAELDDVNALLAAHDEYRQVIACKAGDSPPLMWHRYRRSAGLASAVLLPLADDIGDLLTGVDFTLVRRCEADDCTLHFLDRTKSHARRWCSMAGCGNRAKAAAHRARHRRANRS